MKQLKYLFAIIGLVSLYELEAQPLDEAKLAHYEKELDDVMEITDIEVVKALIPPTTTAFSKNPNALNQARLGILYHEVALNLTFFYKTPEYAGYAKKSHDLLSELILDLNTPKELLVFAEVYCASALSLMSAETRKLKYLSQAFELFEESVQKYAHFSPRPEFMRGSVAENLPKIMWRKRKYAKVDFESIIKKQETQPAYADFRVMSFSYWAWANAHSAKRHRKQAIAYLNKAIAIDPDYKAGRKRAEELLKALEDQS